MATGTVEGEVMISRYGEGRREERFAHEHARSRAKGEQEKRS